MLLFIILATVVLLIFLFLTKKAIGSIYKYIVLVGIIIIFSLMLTNKVTVFTAPFYCYKSKTFLTTQYEQMYMQYKSTGDESKLIDDLRDTRGNLGLLKLASEKTVIGKSGYEKTYNQLIEISKNITERDRNNKDKIQEDLKSAISLLGGNTNE